MTLHKDNIWSSDPGNWLHEWCLDCDVCGDHIHIPPTKGDPRMSDRLHGWWLDIDGQDYCPKCVVGYEKS